MYVKKGACIAINWGKQNENEKQNSAVELGAEWGKVKLMTLSGSTEHNMSQNAIFLPKKTIFCPK